MALARGCWDNMSTCSVTRESESLSSALSEVSEHQTRVVVDSGISEQTLSSRPAQVEADVATGPTFHAKRAKAEGLRVQDCGM